MGQSSHGRWNRFLHERSHWYIHASHFYHPPMKLMDGNVFGHVCPSFCPQRVPMWPLPMIHCTSLYRPTGTSLPLSRHGTSLHRNLPAPSRHGTSWYREPPQLSPPLPHIWRPSLHTCSNLFTTGSPSADIWWLLKQVESTQGCGTHPTGMLSCGMVFSLLYHVNTPVESNVAHYLCTTDDKIKFT